MGLFDKIEDLVFYKAISIALAIGFVIIGAASTNTVDELEKALDQTLTADRISFNQCLNSK